VYILIVCIYVGTFSLSTFKVITFFVCFVVGFDYKCRVVFHFVDGISLLIVK